MAWDVESTGGSKAVTWPATPTSVPFSPASASSRKQSPETLAFRSVEASSTFLLFLCFVLFILGLFLKNKTSFEFEGKLVLVITFQSFSREEQGVCFPERIRLVGRVLASLAGL